MASLLGSNMSRAHVLQLPPAIRTSIYARSLPRRTFSSTASRKNSIVQVVIAGPTAILDAVHVLGIPWYAAIPATAVLVRCTIGYYVAALPARKRAIVRAYLAPLSSNSARKKTRKALLEKMIQDEKAAGKVASQPVQRIRGMAYGLWYKMREDRRIGKIFNAPLVTPASFVNFGLLIMFAEAIRLKCGHREGMLSMILHPLEQFYKGSKGKSAGQTLSPEQIMAERMEAAQAAADAQAELYASGTGDVVVDPKLLDPVYHFELMGQSAQAYADSLDPTMLVEGVSWAQNLALPDSTFILPSLLSASILLGAFRPDSRAYTTPDPNEREILSALTRTKKVTGRSVTKVPFVKGRDVAKAQIDASAASVKQTQIEASISARTKEINAAFALADDLRSETKAQGEKGVLLSSWTFGQKFRLWMAGVFFLVASGLPSGMLLYMIPSVLVGQLHSRWLDVKYPMPTIIQPCKREMRFKVTKLSG